MVIQHSTIWDNLCGFTLRVTGMTYKGFPKLHGHASSKLVIRIDQQIEKRNNLTKFHKIKQHLIS